MENFSQQVVTNNISSPHLSTYESSTREENLYEHINSLKFIRNKLKFTKLRFSRFKMKIFDMDISSVTPIFRVFEPFSRIDEITDFPNLNLLSFDFNYEIPPKDQYKIKVKFRKFRKATIDKTDFLNLI